MPGGDWQAGRWPHCWLKYLSTCPVCSGKAYIRAVLLISHIEMMSLRTSTCQCNCQAPGPSYREDDMYKVQSSPNQTLGPVLFRILLSHFLGQCLLSLFTTATMTCGMLGCIKYVRQVFYLFVYTLNRVRR